MRRPVLLAALAMVLCPFAPARAAPPPKDPKLIVAISVDQFAESLFQTYRPSFTGGFRRLETGVDFVGWQSHAATETCPGHSTILTGDHPARTGIVANNWYDRKTGSNIYCVTAIGTADPLARTSARLKVDTLGDWMRAKDPRSRVVSVSGKDRAAIMLAGHHPSDVFWWNDGMGFGTASQAGPLDPVGLKTAAAFNRTLFRAWTQKPPVLWPATAPAACAALQKPYTFGKLALSGKIPPESASGFPKGAALIADDGFNAELRASPAFDPLTLRFAERLAAAKRLGRGPAPDLLAVSLSSTDFIGHRYGGGGAEMCAQMAALDAALGAFFRDLDRGGIPYVVVLTADHGAIDAAERLGPPASRVDVAAIVGGLNRRLRQRFDLGYDPIVGDDPRQIILELPPGDLPRRGEMLAEAADWLKARPEVSGVYAAEAVAAAVPRPGTDPEALTPEERFHESYDPERSGDLLVSYREGASLGVPAGPGANIAGHGSIFDYDRRVPILFWWPGVTPETPNRAAETVDIAPTLAAMLKIAPPPIDGRCLDLGQGCPG